MSDSPQYPLFVCSDCEQASALANELSLPLAKPSSVLPDNACVLRFDAGGLGIEWAGRKQNQRFVVDFTDPAWRQRRQRGSEMLVKAMGGGQQRQALWDLTAGWGRDAWVLAMHGYPVQMIEQNPIVVALLRDALKRAEQYGGDAAETAQRVTLIGARAESVLAAAEAPVPLIYMDPMFETKSKKQALSGKDLQWLQRLNSRCTNGHEAGTAEGLGTEALVIEALGRAEYRVVVKRAAKAPVLVADRCSHFLSGKAHRFDIYGLKKLP